VESAAVDPPTVLALSVMTIVMTDVSATLAAELLLVRARDVVLS